MTVNFYKYLYRNHQGNVQLIPLKGCFPKLQEEDLLDIHKKLSKLEIKEAILSMGALKAPRLDGLHVFF